MFIESLLVARVQPGDRRRTQAQPGLHPGYESGVCSYALLVELRLGSAAVDLQRPALAHRVRPLEYPVLPGTEPREDARLHRLLAGESQVRFETRQRIGRHAGTLFERDADLVVPVDVVGRGGDQAEWQGFVGSEHAAPRGG